MNIDSCIENRKSIRKYSNKKVDLKLIGQLIETATKAPSSGNIQNWKFVVVTDKKIKDKLVEAALNQTWMKSAQIFVVVCSDTEKVEKAYPKRGSLYATQNCAIAATYMMLKATDLGLSTCWVGAFAPNMVSKALELPPGIIPEVILTIGYAQKDVLKRTPRIAYKKITHFEVYGQKELEDSIFPISEKLETSIKKILEKLKLKK